MYDGLQRHDDGQAYVQHESNNRESERCTQKNGAPRWMRAHHRNQIHGRCTMPTSKSQGDDAHSRVFFREWRGTNQLLHMASGKKRI
mmetsp:Transcript_9982/g.32202  ORF Transcript_9982/g.32202 Transcript_9982/m.32202 type:complete len:87 (+) Transcript_9982:249-509(+)